ncbi:MAG: iron-only hydrogenase system regulator [bacterium]|nr:iron-only hydrogenase system regulator [bacterium]
MTEEAKKEDNRIGVAAVIVEDPESAREVNEVLHNFSGLIVGRLGIPYRERGVSVISLVLDGVPDQISALTGKLGKIKSVTVKAAMSKK